MGCIPSKQSLAEKDDVLPIPGKSRRLKPKWKKTYTAQELPSPVVDGDAPPWVKGHAVLTEKNGTLVIVDSRA